MLNCADCLSLTGRDASVDPHAHLIADSTLRLFENEIQAYHCAQCGTEWGIVKSAGIKQGHWIRRAGEAG